MRFFTMFKKTFLSLDIKPIYTAPLFPPPPIFNPKTT